MYLTIPASSIISSSTQFLSNAISLVWSLADRIQVSQPYITAGLIIALDIFTFEWRFTILLASKPFIVAFVFSEYFRTYFLGHAVSRCDFGFQICEVIDSFEFKVLYTTVGKRSPYLVHCMYFVLFSFILEPDFWNQLGKFILQFYFGAGNECYIISKGPCLVLIFNFVTIASSPSLKSMLERFQFVLHHYLYEWTSQFSLCTLI